LLNDNIKWFLKFYFLIKLMSSYMRRTYAVCQVSGNSVELT